MTIDIDSCRMHLLNRGGLKIVTQRAIYRYYVSLSCPFIKATFIRAALQRPSLPAVRRDDAGLGLQILWRSWKGLG